MTQPSGATSFSTKRVATMTKTSVAEADRIRIFTGADVASDARHDDCGWGVDG
jgi:hypothetical protein